MIAESPEIDDLTLQRVRRGDADAWRTLVGIYQRRVYGLCRRILGRTGSTLAQDAAQETFVDVYLGLAELSLDDHTRLSSWILSIAAHRAIDLSRRHDSQLRLLANVAERQQVVASRATMGDHDLDLDAVMAQLSPMHRAVFVLSDVYEFSYAEVASALAISVGTVKSRLFRARAAAREALTATDDDQQRRRA